VDQPAQTNNSKGRGGQVDATGKDNTWREKVKLQKVDEIIDKYDGEKSWLVMILQDIQQEYHYLPASALERVASILGISLSQVYNVATFYSSFSLTKRGKHLVRFCDGTACHLRGSGSIHDEIKRHLGIEVGQTTPNKKFTFEDVACLGACALAPVMTVDSKYYGSMTPEKVRQALEQYKAEP
jgi:NADH-quinone oxidoreductase E subunit